ncbi:MAG: hypothetical protein OXC00_10575 [Acidimicrobiaceae bacterium]|nr:hypothetical protein [Acidimicrobiaceae bacterium]
MARTWLSITVELVSGRGERYWPRPGRVFVASRSHTFAALAAAINDGFARWDHAHLSRFALADGTAIADVDPFFDLSDDSIDIRTAKLSRLRPSEQFAYTFDLGDGWQHLCTVDAKRIDPEEVYGLEPRMPAPCFGWGWLPDQYGRLWAADDGGSPPPADTGDRDLPPLLYEWQ